MRTALLLACMTVSLLACLPPSQPPEGGGGAAAITSFALVAPPTVGVIDEPARSVRACVPWDTDRHGLVAAFAFSGSRVTVGGVEQESGVTPNDFSLPLEYRVEGSDGSAAVYLVTVETAARPGAGKDITEFSFLDPPVAAVIDAPQHAITAVVPRGTDCSSLVACYVTTGTSVKVAGAEQESGVTVNDFTEPVPYAVYAEDGSVQTYIVTVVQAPSQEKTMRAFTVQAAGAAAAIDEEHRIIRVRVPEGTGRSSLVAVFETTGAAVRVAGIAQHSGVTINDFTSPVDYEVQAEDGSLAVYSVRVTDRIALVVNEVDADQVGTDNAEFIELYATGDVDLWGIAVILVNGGVTPGPEYARIDLTTLGALASGGYLVIAGPQVQVAAAGIKYTPAGWELSNRIQNGPNDAVMVWDALGQRVVDTVTYAGVLHRAVIAGQAGELDATEGSAGAPADSNTTAGSIARLPNAQDTGQNGADFRFAPVLTPGAPNQ